MKRLLIVLASGIAVIIAIAACYYWLLWQPSLRGECAKPEMYRISKLRGRVVGKSLSLLQYRWLRRRFIAVGTTLELHTEHCEDRPGIGLIGTGKAVGTQIVGDAGTFDFGELPPDQYTLGVKLPGDDTFGFHFVLDPEAHNTDVLIDVSP